MSERGIEIDSMGVEVCEEVGDYISIIGVCECLEAESLFVSTSFDPRIKLTIPRGI